MWGGVGWWRPTDRLVPLPEGYTATRTVREASGLLSLTSTLYLRPGKADRDASFQCSVRYRLPAGQEGHLDSPSFHLSLHCESTLAWGPHPGLRASLWPPPPPGPLLLYLALKGVLATHL